LGPVAVRVGDRGDVEDLVVEVVGPRRGAVVAVEREDERARRADGDLRGAGAVVEDGDVPDGAEAGGGPDEAAVGAAAALERARADAAREEGQNGRASRTATGDAGGDAV